MNTSDRSYDYLRFEDTHAEIDKPLLYLFLEQTEQLWFVDEILTSGSRMYFAEWEIKDERLFLTKAECCIGDTSIDLIELLFPVSQGKQPISWFTGNITVETETFATSCISHLATKKIEFEFQRGRVHSIWRMQRDLLPQDKKEIEARIAYES